MAQNRAEQQVILCWGVLGAVCGQGSCDVVVDTWCILRKYAKALNALNCTVERFKTAARKVCTDIMHLPTLYHDIRA